MLEEADLFNEATPKALIDRVAAGLLPIKAKGATYSDLPFGAVRKSMTNPIRWSEIVMGLGSSQINFDDKTLKNDLVRGGGQARYNFIAIDVELGRAEILDFIGPTPEAQLLPFASQLKKAADLQPNTTVELAKKRGRQSGDGSFDQADDKFVREIIQMEKNGEVTSVAEGAREVVRRHKVGIKGRTNAPLRLAKKALKIIRLSEANSRNAELETIKSN
jgi:hypothetical protein